MIVCRLELWPGGVEEAAEHLGTIELSNQIIRSLRSDGKRGDYHVVLYKKRKTKPKSGKFKTKVRDFPRLSYHPWNLVRIALNQIAEKNGGTI
jgi:hypothetical protein